MMLNKRWWWLRGWTDSTPWGESTRRKNHREVKKNRLLLWGKEKIDIIVRCKLLCRRNEINYRGEAERNWLSPWGANGISPWGGMAARPEEISPWGGAAVTPEELSSWGGAAIRPKEYHREGAPPQGQRNIAMWGRGHKAKGLLLWGGAATRPKEYCAKAVRLEGAQPWWASNNQKVLSQESCSPVCWPEENVIITPVNTQIGCRTWQSLDSTAVELSSWWTTPEHHLDERRVKWVLD
jgi:hypothetical protein